MRDSEHASLDYLLEFQNLASSVETIKKLFANLQSSTECELPDVFANEINESLESLLKEFVDIERENFDFILQSSQKLRQVAGGLSGAYQMLKTTSLSSEQQNYVNFVSMGLSGLMSVVDDLLLFIQYQTGKVSEKRYSFEVLPLIEGIVSYFHARTRGSRIEVCFSFGKNVPKEIIGDSDKLRQILNTILDLSLSSTYEGKISIRVSWEKKKERSLVITVEDSGDRLETSNTTEELLDNNDSAIDDAGTSLSLRLCRKIVSLLDGEFTLNSSEDGNRFELQLNFVPKRDEMLFDSLETVGIRKFHYIGEPSVEFETLRYSVASYGFSFHCIDSWSQFEDYLNRSYLNEKDCVVVLESWGVSSVQLRKLVQSIEPHRRPFCVFVSDTTEVERLGDVSDFGFFDKLEFPVFPSKIEGILLRIGTLLGSSNQVETKVEGYRGDVVPDFNRVLIVDDNRFNAYVLEKLVRKIGCSATIASDGFSAIQLLESSDFDIILMDCVMPGMSGFETAERIRTGSNNSDVPIVAITANHDQETRRHCFQSGMNDFLNKPVHLKLLKETIDRWGGESIFPISADGMSHLEFTQKALELNNALFRDICEQFCELIDFWKVELVEARTHSKTNAFCQHCYYLRSNLSMLGQEEPFLLIRDVEEQAKSGKWDQIDSGLQALREHLEKAVSLCRHRVKTNGADIVDESLIAVDDLQSSLDVLKGAFVLVIDSDPLTIRFFSSLESYGLKILSAGSTQGVDQLLDTIDQERLACCVCSDNCNGFDDLRFLKHARSLDEQVSCFLYAHRANKALVNEALTLGAVEVIPKPSSLTTLIKSLASGAIKTRHNQSLIATRKAAEKMGSSQLNLLTSGFEEGETHATEVVYHPQQEAGGDFFVKYQLDNGNKIVLLTDVSGHDLESAYVSAYFHGMMRGAVSSGNQTVVSALESFNSFLVKEWNKKGNTTGYIDRSIAVDAVELDARKKEVHFYLGGGCIPCVVYKKGGARFVNDKTGTPLGWFDEPLIEVSSIDLETIAFAFLWSDGIEVIASAMDVNNLAVVSALLLNNEKGFKPDWVAECSDDLLAIRFSEHSEFEHKDIFPVFVDCFRGSQADDIDEIQSKLKVSIHFLWVDIPEQLLHDLLFCCREALLNGFEHGCRGNQSKTVYFSFIYDRKKNVFVCEVEDEGEGFDIDEVLMKEKTERFHCGTNMIQVMSQYCRYSNDGRKLIMHFDTSTLAEPV